MCNKWRWNEAGKLTKNKTGKCIFCMFIEECYDRHESDEWFNDEYLVTKED